MKKKLKFTMSSSDPIRSGAADRQDTLYEILFAGLRALDHIPKDARCDAVEMTLAFFEGEAEGCKLRPIHNPVTIEAEIPIERQARQLYQEER